MPVNGKSPLPSTDWATVQHAGQIGPGAQTAIGALFERYRGPMRAHLVRRHGYRDDQAEDVIQAFVTDQIIARRILQHADPDRGRFRSFLLTSLERYSLNYLRDRRGDREADRLSRFQNDAGVLTDAQRPPLRELELQWAKQVVAEAVEAMRRACTESGRTAVWDLFAMRVVRPILDGDPPPDYDQLVKHFGFTSATDAGNRLITGKRMFRKFLRQIVAQYAATDADIDAELAEIRAILAG